MRKLTIFIFLLLVILFSGITYVYAQAVSLSFFPGQIIQGEPLLVQINGITDITLIKKITFDGKSMGIFVYQNKPSALVGVGLNKKPGMYQLTAEFSNGNILRASVVVGERKKVEVPLGIPLKLGGNTKASQDKLVASLIAETKSLSGIPTANKALWADKFIPPLAQIFVTDSFGFSRKTGAYSIPHIGVDYRAKQGTDVMAVNRGIVRITNWYRDYGNTIVIDHGLGLMTYYLHLSKYNVKVGDTVERGQIIGLSGATGYATGPHLHLSVVIDKVSIDPVKFFELFQ
jgi:murein DD-endopeptidase MepM/ murein hydrolase activator NlpD